MATQVKSIAALMNEIRSSELALPDLQRDFVWSEEQIRVLLDSVMRDYPFGFLLFWNTQFLEVVYREFTANFRSGQTFHTLTKRAGEKKRMVLDGQQRLQALYLAFNGTYDGRRLFFNITSGPDSSSAVQDDDVGRNYRFEFWRDDEPSRPKRLICVAEVVGWANRFEDDEIDRTVTAIGLTGEEATLARRNLRLLRSTFTRDLVPITIVDDDIIRSEQAKKPNEILEIFVRVNSGGTRLSRSDLMFSLIKTKWARAREHFDELQHDLQKTGLPDADKDFIIRGLLTVSDLPTAFDVGALEKHWDKIESQFPVFRAALLSSIDFCRSHDVRILPASLLSPVATLYPVVYYLAQQKNGSVPDDQRQALRAMIYFLLFNEFLGGKSPEARVRFVREAFQKHPGTQVPVDAVLAAIAKRQRQHAVSTTYEMLGWSPRLTLNIAQPLAARDTLSWQEKAEVDHIFPQSIYRPIHGDLVDDIGNFGYLGKLRNIRKSNDEPADYFAHTSDVELRDDFLIDDRNLLTRSRFLEFIERRRARILATVKNFLGR